MKGFSYTCWNMERFKNINWNPPLEHIIDNVFITDERLQRDSVMHKILSGNFVDPFKDIDEDYKNVKIELIRKEAIELSDEGDDNEKKRNSQHNKMQKNSEQEPPKAKKPYVPGIVKPAFKFPRKSSLNKEQQAACLRVMLRFSRPDKPKLSQLEREELQNYVDLQPVINQEQDEFLEFAKTKWPSRPLKIFCEEYINLRWKSKLQYVNKLPKYYAEVVNVPFMANKKVEVKCDSICLEGGQLPKITLPAFNRPYVIRIDSEQLQERFPPKNYMHNDSTEPYKLPVSEDPNCKKLAEDNSVDLVISSSGLNCLVNNIGPNYMNSWILPVVIQAHNGKNIVYIDKALPPTADTITEKNTWVYKFAVRRFFVHTAHRAPRSNTACNDNIFENDNSEQLIKLEEQHDSSLKNADDKANKYATIKHANAMKPFIQWVSATESNPGSAQQEKDQCTSNSNPSSSTQGEAPENKSETFEEARSVKKDIGHTESNSETPSNSSVSYKLFTLTARSVVQNELLKDNIAKEYKVLVRTKTDGFEISETGALRLLMLAPKLEHQVDLGAEAVTLKEALRQWISLIFRPDTFLARVRISAETSEVLQIEYRTAVSINNEIKRLYNVNAEDSLTILHNVTEFLRSLAPGRYVMRHTVRNGAFVTIYKEVDAPGKNTVDLRTVCGDQYFTLPNTTWIPLDKTVSTPMHKCFERMPAMFYPPNTITTFKNAKSQKEKKNSPGAVRRSQRNKKNPRRST